MSSLDNNHVAARIRADLDAIVIENPRASAAHGVFDYLIEHSERYSTGGKRCVLMTGPTQSGKSTIIESYAARLNTPDLREKRQIPVLHVVLEANISRKGLAQNILEALEELGIQAGTSSGSETILLRRVRAYLKAAGVKLLVLDEFQHVVHSDNDRVANSVGETIKRMLIKGVCPIVMCGIRGAERPFKTNSQLAQRAEPAIALSPIEACDPADAEFYMEFLASYLLQVEDVAGIENATSLLNDTTPSMIVEVANGVLGAACNLIKGAVTLAVRDGRYHITGDDLALATDRYFIADGLCFRNPFRDGFDAVRPNQH